MLQPSLEKMLYVHVTDLVYIEIETVMYANIAAHRAVRSWFLRLIVNVVICAPWGCA